MSYEWFAVNKSSQTIDVWDMTGSSIIGHLYQREAFGRKYVGSGYRQVRFRDGSGNVRDGLVFNTDYLPSSWETPCTNYPYGTVTLDGQTYYTFMFRRDENIYKPDGTYWGLVLAGKRVACLDATSGSSHPEWKCIQWYESSRGWATVCNDYGYGFVDTGLDHGSMPDTISMYGTW